MGQAADVPECLECGACCFSKLATYVRVGGDDYQRLGEKASDLTEFHGNRCYMRMVDGHCAALSIDSAERRFVCRIYADRPATCRDLARGSPSCQGEIHTKGERPMVALRSLLRRPTHG